MFSGLDLHFHPRSHRRSDDDREDVVAFDACRARFFDRREEDVQILTKFLRAEGALAEDDVDDALLVHLALDAAFLQFLDDLADALRDGARLRRGHQAFLAEDLRDFAELLHHHRHRDGDVEVDRAALDLLDQILVADEVRARFLRFVDQVVRDERRDADALARAVRQVDRRADQLVGLRGVRADADVCFRSRIEGTRRELRQQFHRLSDGIALLRDQRLLLCVLLAHLAGEGTAF